MIFFRGATAWEWQIGRLYGRLPFWRYLRVGCRPSLGWDTSNREVD